MKHGELDWDILTNPHHPVWVSFEQKRRQAIYDRLATVIADILEQMIDSAPTVEGEISLEDTFDIVDRALAIVKNRKGIPCRR